MTAHPSLPQPPWRKRLKERLAWHRHGLSWTAVAVGGLGTAMALWPLATTLWDLLGLTTDQSWRATTLGLCALLLATGVVGVNWNRTTPVRLLWLILAAWALAAGTVAAMTALAWLVLDTPQWKPPRELTPQNLDAIATRAFAIVAGLSGVALLVIAYRRQRTTEADAQRAERAAEREVSKLFTDTFDSASDKLGSEHAAVRLAGVHALARLADEAPEGREDLVQMVIDVLCAYLRIPYTPAPDPLPKNASKDRQKEHRARELEFASFREVRHTIIRIIGNHLREPTRWRGRDYDFTGVAFDGGDLNGARFFGGEVSFIKAQFTSGNLVFNDAEFVGTKVSFAYARFIGSGLSLAETRFTDSRVSFFGTEFVGGGVSFFKTEFVDSELLFANTRFIGSTMDFAHARFTSGMTTFNRAEFAGSMVSFRYARFTSDRVDFPGTRFISGEVNFEHASGMCPGMLLESIELGKSGVVILPDSWQVDSEEAPPMPLRESRRNSARSE